MAETAHNGIELTELSHQLNVKPEQIFDLMRWLGGTKNKMVGEPPYKVMELISLGDPDAPDFPDNPRFKLGFWFRTKIHPTNAEYILLQETAEAWIW